ncbi:CHAP domain-containing protein [Amycolatopsis acidicola]|uniref:CHAP domain-containing protein n=1 Tax=Amycolatopsis acidicola TaxID=2596893 RepID=A0A5N0ULF3_9PSEU|nr:CHAP domain-containing protein [Amycolatopsis acidicola]KAA9148162.1 CHAP domain-containing protein [Amycolatopsis acidicola]
MDIASIATLFADEMKTHHGKLEGKAGEAQAAQNALESAARSVMEQHDTQRKAARTLMSHWESEASGGFEGKSAKFGDDLTVTAEASMKGAKIVSEVTGALSARHSATGGLVDEFVTKANGLIKAGFAMAGLAAPGALLKAMGEVTDLAGQYLKESSGQLKDARSEMEEAARKLRALEKDLNSDGVGDPGKAQPHKPSQGKEKGKEKGKTKPGSSSKAGKILEHARKNLGYHEGPNNRNKWGPTGQPWCAYFATSMWREAGVNIPKYGFTGDVYKWGERHHTAYDRGDIAKQARPGDAILFGTGPTWGGSEHIGIIEKVDGNKITTIEGNSSDQVMRHTYTLPRDAKKFYGGVHPK